MGALEAGFRDRGVGWGGRRTDFGGFGDAFAEDFDLEVA